MVGKTRLTVGKTRLTVGKTRLTVGKTRYARLYGQIGPLMQEV